MWGRKDKMDREDGPEIESPSRGAPETKNRTEIRSERTGRPFPKLRYLGLRSQGQRASHKGPKTHTKAHINFKRPKITRNFSACPGEKKIIT